MRQLEQGAMEAAMDVLNEGVSRRINIAVGAIVLAALAAAAVMTLRFFVRT